jgi:disulfide bond formation protein DsbB
VAAALLAVALAACSSSAVPTPIGDASKGKDKYATTCVSCHGPDAKGMPGLGKDLTTSEYTKSLTDVDFVDFVLKGRSTSDPANTTGVDMPPKGGNPALTEDDIKDIVSYLRTLQK